MKSCGLYPLKAKAKLNFGMCVNNHCTIENLIFYIGNSILNRFILLCIDFCFTLLLSSKIYSVRSVKHTKFKSMFILLIAQIKG